jgi:hypothetical protein
MTKKIFKECIIRNLGPLDKIPELYRIPYLEGYKKGFLDAIKEFYGKKIESIRDEEE